MTESDVMSGRSQQVDITDDVIAEAVVTAAPARMNKRAPGPKEDIESN